MSAGKGDKPRNNFSKDFRAHYDDIDWGHEPNVPHWMRPVDKGKNNERRTKRDKDSGRN